MDKEKYLQKILQSQTLSPDSEELKALQGHRADVEALIRKHFDKSSVPKNKPYVPSNKTGVFGAIKKVFTKASVKVVVLTTRERTGSVPSTDF